MFNAKKGGIKDSGFTLKGLKHHKEAKTNCIFSLPPLLPFPFSALRKCRGDGVHITFWREPKVCFAWGPYFLRAARNHGIRSHACKGGDSMRENPQKIIFFASRYYLLSHFSPFCAVLSFPSKRAPQCSFNTCPLLGQGKLGSKPTCTKKGRGERKLARKT